MSDRSRSDTPPYPQASASPIAMLADQVARLVRDVGKMQESLARLIERSEEQRRASDRFQSVDWPRLESELEELRDRIAGTENKLLTVELFRRDVQQLKDSVEALKDWRARVMGGALVVSMIGSGFGAAVLDLVKWLAER